MSEPAYLEAALRLGREVAAAATWSGDRCSWIGAMPEEKPEGIVLTYRSFGPDLYAGTAGVGLALAELFDACEGDEPDLRRTARGAIEHGLSRVDEAPPSTRLGAYGGSLGTALCAARVGKLLGEEELIARAGEIVAALDYREGPLENDVIGGRAGGILALLTLRAMGVAEATLERAGALGRDLIAAAEPGEAGWSWPSPAYPDQRHLTGFSHGAGGIGTALLQLGRESGEAEFEDAAERAFAYERALFDPRARNWPDLREHILGERPEGEPPPCATLWCHGAPGIALSRLRVCELGDRNGSKQEAGLALKTTAASVQAQLEGGNYSLCHGIGGNAEILAEGSSLFPEGASLARRVADQGIERHLEADLPWPLGVYSGQSDSLMLGRAGTAYFYLRLHDPARPSVLLLRPESFA